MERAINGGVKRSTDGLDVSHYDGGSKGNKYCWKMTGQDMADLDL